MANSTVISLASGIVERFFSNSFGVWFPLDELRGLSPEEIHGHVLRKVCDKYPNIARERIVVSDFTTGTLVIVLEEEACKQAFKILK
jgi:hypothetical protein